MEFYKWAKNKGSKIDLDTYLLEINKKSSRPLRQNPHLFIWKIEVAAAVTAVYSQWATMKRTFLRFLVKCRRGYRALPAFGVSWAQVRALESIQKVVQGFNYRVNEPAAARPSVSFTTRARLVLTNHITPLLHRTEPPKCAKLHNAPSEWKKATQGPAASDPESTDSPRGALPHHQATLSPHTHQFHRDALTQKEQKGDVSRAPTDKSTSTN